jgi:hypothetical protein
MLKHPQPILRRRKRSSFAPKDPTIEAAATMASALATTTPARLRFTEGQPAMLACVMRSGEALRKYFFDDASWATIRRHSGCGVRGGWARSRLPVTGPCRPTSLLPFGGRLGGGVLMSANRVDDIDASAVPLGDERRQRVRCSFNPVQRRPRR